MLSPQVARESSPVLQVPLRDILADFLLDRQAQRLSNRTVEYYVRTAGAFVSWCEARGTQAPKANDVRGYLAQLAERKLADATLATTASGIRAMLSFASSEGYLPAVKVKMPKVEKKRMRTLDSEDLGRVLAACRTHRERAIVSLLADSGLRRAEAVALNWGNVDLQTGLLIVERGKGRKARVAAIGAKTRQALLRYRRTVPHGDSDPLFLGRTGRRLEAQGLRAVVERAGQRAGVRVNCHALRRTYATLALRGGMSVLHLQRQLGHAFLSTTERYVSLDDADLIAAAATASPVDRLH